MKKVLIIFGGKQFSEGAFEFARKMNELDPILMSGVFVPQTTYINLATYAAVPMGGGEFIPLNDDETMVVKQNVDEFEKRCRANGIAFHAHFDNFDFTLPELALQTRFSDLMIIGSEKFYEDIVGEDPEHYLRDVLHTAECPVVVVPERFDFPSRNVFAYDGGSSSVFAIRQFMYLFPKLCIRNESTFVYAKEDPDLIPEEAGIRELAEAHLPNHDFLKLDINPRKFFSTWISERKGSMLVGGYSGRLRIGKVYGSKVFNQVIAEHLLPVFIAHR
jgi:hypothetical protein